MSKTFREKAEEVLQSLNPRFMASDPWRSIDQALESLIDKVVLELNPDTLDDNINDTLDDWDNRVEAIDYLVEKLQKQKAE
jgi:nitrate/nitrite-specific signal transduction histidine kinase